MEGRACAAPCRSIVALLLVGTLLAAAPRAAATPVQTDGAGPIFAAVVDEWTVGNRAPRRSAQDMVRASAGSTTFALDGGAAPTSLSVLLFPSAAARAPLTPSLAHDAVAGSRPDPGPAPTDAEASPLAETADEPSETRISVFAALLTGAPQAIVDAARFGLRDVVIAGLAARDVAPSPVARRTETDVAVTPAEAGRTRRILLILSGLIAVTATGLLLLYVTRRRPPRKAWSRRFG